MVRPLIMYSHLSKKPRRLECMRRGCKRFKINKCGGGNKCGQGATFVKLLNKIHKEGKLCKRLINVEEGGKI